VHWIKAQKACSLLINFKQQNYSAARCSTYFFFQVPPSWQVILRLRHWRLDCSSFTRFAAIWTLGVLKPRTSVTCETRSTHAQSGCCNNGRHRQMWVLVMAKSSLASTQKLHARTECMAIHMRIHDICCLLNKPAGVVVVGCSDRLGSVSPQ
jgi:hypothetical protein